MSAKIINMSNDSLKGKFLISSPAIGDNRFCRSVIFIATDNETGSMGVVINKPSAHTFTHIAKSVNQNLDVADINLGECIVNISLGGPVNSNNLFIIHSNDYQINQTIPVLKEISMTNQPQTIIDLIQNQGPKNSLIAIGCSTWEKDQLRQEINENSWIIYPFDPKYLFQNPPYQLYDQILKDLGITNTNPAMFVNNKSHTTNKNN